MFNKIPDNIVELAEKLSQAVKGHAPRHKNSLFKGEMFSHDTLKNLLNHDLLKTGVALGAARTGARATGNFVKRHPMLVGGVAVGAGLLYLAARYRAKKAAQQPLQGKAVRLNKPEQDSRIPPGDDAGEYFE